MSVFFYCQIFDLPIGLTGKILPPPQS